MLAAIGMDSMRGREGVRSLITEDLATRLENLCLLIDNENAEEFKRLVRGTPRDVVGLLIECYHHTLYNVAIVYGT